MTIRCHRQVLRAISDYQSTNAIFPLFVCYSLGKIIMRCSILTKCKIPNQNAWRIRFSYSFRDGAEVFRISRIDPAAESSYEDGIGIYERNSKGKSKLYFRTSAMIFLRVIITIDWCGLTIGWCVSKFFFTA